MNQPPTPPFPHEMSVRTQDSGGPVADSVAEYPPHYAQGKLRLVVMVHGFNNNLNDGRASYYDLLDGFSDSLGGPFNNPVDLFDGFYWPGDKDLGFFSFISYPAEPKYAVQSAAVLQQFLTQLQGPTGGPIEVDFIGHSLGCRLLSECLAGLSKQKGLQAQFKATCFMAPAVPVNFQPVTQKLVTAAQFTNLLVLFSSGDNVLRFAFPLGQTAAGEGFFPTALGRVGPFPGLQAQGQAFNQLDHGDYWKSGPVAEKLTSFLGLKPPAAGPSSYGTQSYSAQAPRQIQSRSIGG